MGRGYENSGSPAEGSYRPINGKGATRDVAGRTYEKLRNLSYLALFHVIGDDERAERIRAAMRRLKIKHEDNSLASKLE